MGNSTFTTASMHEHVSPSNRYGRMRWSHFFGQQCCLEYKRHDYEKGIIEIKAESGAPDSSPTQIRRRVQTASSGHGPQWAAGALSRSSSGHQRECAPPLEAGGHRQPIELRT